GFLPSVMQNAGVASWFISRLYHFINPELTLSSMHTGSLALGACGGGFRFCKFRARAAGGGYVNARELIAGAVLEPAMLAIVGKVFDQAWDTIKERFASEVEIVRVREQLARLVLSSAAKYPDDVEG